MKNKPNILLILNDDMGFSDIGCYGGEIDSPNLDRLAQDGIRFSQFYNTARCCPSRASLLTGLHPHQTGIGVLTNDMGPEGYRGNLNNECVTIAEVLKENGYGTYMSGKWHIASNVDEPSEAWPLQRGFDHFYGTIIGAGSYYSPNSLTNGNENIEHEITNDSDFFYTDAISDQAVKFINEHTEKNPSKPFFQYVAYTAPHWPLHAREKDIAKYKGRFDGGWDQLREKRMQRLIEMGMINSSWELTERDSSQPEWDKTENKEWLLRCMEVYAAQIDRMDQGIGRIMRSLEETGQLENTVIFFLSDNGACAEEIPAHVKNEDLAGLRFFSPKTKDKQEVIFGNDPNIMPGPENTFQSYGQAWANLSNTPFRFYKHWVHEGGIATPFIVHWPKGIKEKGAIRHTPAQLTDVMATIIDITDAKYPKTYKDNTILPLEGQSILSALNSNTRARKKALYWEHEGNAAIRINNWKLVRDYPHSWELYDLNKDRTEKYDLAQKHPEKVAEMDKQYQEWAKRCRIIPREKILKMITEDIFDKNYER